MCGSITSLKYTVYKIEKKCCILEDDNIEDKISANIEGEEATSELLISEKSEELKSINSGVQLLAKELGR